MNLPPFRIVRPGADVWVTLEVADNDPGVCGIYEIKGTVRLPPKQWLKAMREEMTIIEQRAREAGCAEMRVAGRDWSRVLTDYERLDGVPNGLRKAL